MVWKTVEYSKTQIIKAGKKVKNINLSTDELKETIAIIDNWRASHAFPLQIFYCHLRKLASKKIIVAQRLKRLDSIVEKLKREPTMSLWTMQDLGGCRVIVPTLDEVYKIVDTYKNSRIRHILKKEYDYIEHPKNSGYRSYHMIYQYHSDKKDTYNRNMLIEIQVRTKLQHLWATTLETMELFTRQALKASQGEDFILRFFALVSSVFASEEMTPIIPQTAENLYDNIHEIRSINNKHHILDQLKAISVATYHMGKEKRGNLKKGYYILIFNYEKHSLSMKYFQTNQINEATNEYKEIESTQTEKKVDAVLVSTDSFNTLKVAYPNYFSDIREFVRILERYI